MVSLEPDRPSAGKRDSKELEFVEKLLAGRYSCRSFRPEPVPRAVITKILATAQRSASWCNSQSWNVAITEGRGTERLRDLLLKQASNEASLNPDFEFPREYRGVYLERRRESGLQLYRALGIERGDKAAYVRQTLENFRFFGAPHVAIITTDEALGIYGAVDCGGYVSNFMLAAHASGVATIAQAAPSSYAKVIRQELNLGADRRMVCAISLGYADSGHSANSYRTSRATVDDIVKWITD